MEDGKTCPTCGEDLEHQAAAVEERERNATAASLSAGRVQFFIAAVPLVALTAYNLFASLIRPEFASAIGFNPVIGLLVTVGLLVAVYAGHFWARVLLGFQLALGILVQISILYRITGRAGLAGAFASCWILPIFALSFVLLCFSPSVSMYLTSHRTKS